jgi:hypothetical protein
MQILGSKEMSWDDFSAGKPGSKGPNTEAPRIGMWARCGLSQESQWLRNWLALYIITNHERLLFPIIAV